MNEQIRELVEQAGFVLWDNEDWRPTDQTVDWSSEYDQELEQLIKLVIDKCVEVCYTRAGNSDYNTGRQHCASDIKEHFGVK